MLVCFTDGATEAQNAAGEEFSEERLLHVVARHAGDGLEVAARRPCGAR